MTTYHLPQEELKQAAENRIIEGKTILFNTVTRCTFIANDLDEQVQTGSRESDKHIEWMGELDIKVPVPKSVITEPQSLTPTLDKALEALTEAHCEIHDVRSIYKRTSGNHERLTAKLAKITEAINELKKFKG